MTRYNSTHSLAERFAIMFGELTAQYITEGRSDDAYIVAVRAFHNANVCMEWGRDKC